MRPSTNSVPTKCESVLNLTNNHRLESRQTTTSKRFQKMNASKTIKAAAGDWLDLWLDAPDGLNRDIHHLWLPTIVSIMIH
jgi:hypothetical protein